MDELKIFKTDVTASMYERKNRKFENEKKEVKSIESPFNVF